MYILPSEINNATIIWIKKYLKNSAFDNFNPHITIGFGEIEKINLPINFKAEKLALFQTGNYITCRKNLFTTRLE